MEKTIDGARGEAETPFVVKLLICFLLADAVQRGIGVGRGWSETLPLPHMIYILWGVTDLLLASLLALGTRAGCVWTQVFLLVHVFYLGHTLAFQDPYLWLQMDVISRGRVFATVILDVAFACALATPKVRAALKN